MLFECPSTDECDVGDMSCHTAHTSPSSTPKDISNHISSITALGRHEQAAALLLFQWNEQRARRI